MTEQKIKELVDKTRGSSFNKDNYEVTLRYNEKLIESLCLFTHWEKEQKGKYPSNQDWLNSVIPPFQRENNKWSTKMKIKFIQNFLSGAKTELLLFRMNERENAKIIDGLQRTTAMLQFMNNEFPIFEEFYFEDLKNHIRLFRTSFTLRIYTFDTWESVGKFYVDMNENITHSAEDIDKAKKWFKEEKEIIL